MFEQHPVPQQISSYQFRLVGDMTLKQFFQLAAGAVIGLLVYGSPLPSLFKWPLIIFAVVMGAAFAFLPLQERPLEEWLSAFFRAIYGPTLYKWKKLGQVQYFANESTTVTSPTGVPAVASTTSTMQDASVAKLEASETSFLNKLSGIGAPAAQTATVALAPQPSLPTMPANNPTPVQQQNLAREQEISARVVSSESIIQPQKPVQTAPEPPKAGTVFVATPQAPAVVVENKKGVGIIDTPKIATPVVVAAPVTPTLATAGEIQGVQAQFSPDAAPPSPATIPNVIVGQVMTADGKIIEGAIMEVMDFQGRPVRALKTNRAGHFMIVTPLPNGQYKIVMEKEGYDFEPIVFEAHGAIIQPIAIRAKVKTL